MHPQRIADGRRREAEPHRSSTTQQTRRTILCSSSMMLATALLLLLPASVSAYSSMELGYSCAVCETFVSSYLAGFMMDTSLNQQATASAPDASGARAWNQPLAVTAMPTPEEFCSSAAHEQLASAHLYMDEESQEELQRFQRFREEKRRAQEAEEDARDAAANGGASRKLLETEEAEADSSFDPEVPAVDPALLELSAQAEKSWASPEFDPAAFDFSELFNAAAASMLSESSSDASSAAVPLDDRAEFFHRRREGGVDDDADLTSSVFAELDTHISSMLADLSDIPGVPSNVAARFAREFARNPLAKSLPTMDQLLAMASAGRKRVNPVPAPVPEEEIGYFQHKARSLCLVYELGRCIRWDEELPGHHSGSADAGSPFRSLANPFSKAFIQQNLIKLREIDAANRAKKDRARLGIMTKAEQAKVAAAERELIRKNQIPDVAPASAKGKRSAPHAGESNRASNLNLKYRRFEECVSLVRELRAHDSLHDLAVQGCSYRNVTKLESIPPPPEAPANAMTASVAGMLGNKAFEDPWAAMRESTERGGYSWPCPPAAACGCMVRRGSASGQTFCSNVGTGMRDTPVRPCRLECLGAGMKRDASPNAKMYTPTLVQRLQQSYTPQEEAQFARARRTAKAENLPDSGRYLPSPTGAPAGSGPLELLILPPFGFPAYNATISFSAACTGKCTKDIASLRGILPITRDIKPDAADVRAAADARKMEQVMAAELDKLGLSDPSLNGYGPGVKMVPGATPPKLTGAAAEEARKHAEANRLAALAMANNGGGGAGGAGGANGSGGGAGGAGQGGAGGGGNGGGGGAGGAGGAKGGGGGDEDGNSGGAEPPPPPEIPRNVGVEEGRDETLADLIVGILKMQKGDPQDMSDVLKSIAGAVSVPTIDAKRCFLTIPPAILRIMMGIPQQSHGPIAPPPVLPVAIAKAAALAAATSAAIAAMCAIAAAKAALMSAMPLQMPPGPPYKKKKRDLSSDEPGGPQGEMPFPSVATAMETHCGKQTPNSLAKKREAKNAICKEHDKCYMRCPIGVWKPICDKKLIAAMIPLECDKPESDMQYCWRHVESYYSQLNLLSMPRYIMQQVKNKCMLPPQYWTGPGKGQG